MYKQTMEGESLKVCRVYVKRRRPPLTAFIIILIAFVMLSGYGAKYFADNGSLVGVVKTRLHYTDDEKSSPVKNLIALISGFDLSSPVTIVQSSLSASSQVPLKEIKAASVNKGEGESLGKITETTIQASASAGYASYDNVFVKNSTTYSIDAKALFEQPLKYTKSDNPTVLILHSHATESYKPTDANYYKHTDTDRTQDTKYNVVRVGEEMAKVLEEAGVNVIHDKTLHDYPDYNSSYVNSLKTVKKYLKKYPSIQVVLDVHRDAMVRGDNTLVKAVTEVEGQKVAQVMLVCGSDLLGLDHKGWRDNLSFAIKLQNEMNSLYPCLARPIDFRKERFNQHMTPNSLIVEVGSNANSLEEAILGGKYAASALARLLQ